MPQPVLQTTVEGDRITIQTDAARAGALLHFLAGGTLQEAANMIGVSRERVRQYLAKAGISSKDRERYSESRYQHGEHRKRQSARPAERKALRRQRMRQVIRTIRYMTQRDGKAPTVNALAEAIRGAPLASSHAWGAPWLSSYLGFYGPNNGCLRSYPRYWRVVSRMYRLAGVSDQRPRVPNRVPTEPESAEMVRQYAAGKSCRQIGEDMGWATGAIHYRLDQTGVTMRQRSDYPPSNQHRRVPQQEAP